MPVSGQIYNTAADEINRRTFRCLVSVSYTRRITNPVPKEIHTHTVLGVKYGTEVDTVQLNAPPPPSSFYNPINEHQKETSMITIVDMVDIMIKQVYCEVLEDLDTFRILDLIDNYLREIEEPVHRGIPDYVEFARQLLEFRQKYAYVWFRRNVYKYPLMLEKYKHYNTGMSRSLLEMFNLSGDKLDYRDGVDKLRDPPYSLEKYVSEQEKQQQSDKKKELSEEEALLGSLFTKWGDVK